MFSNPQLNSLGRGFIPRPKSNLDNTDFLVSFIKSVEIGNSLYLAIKPLSIIFINFYMQTYEAIKKSTLRDPPPIPPFNFYEGGNSE